MTLNPFIFLAVLAGVCATFQSAANSSWAKDSGAALAVAVNGLVFVLVSFVYFAWEFSRGESKFGALKTLSGPQWLGGLFGFGVVMSLTLAFPRLGALLALALMILGQCASGLLVDYFGWYGMPQTGISFTRVLAIVLIMAGVVLLKR